MRRRVALFLMILALAAVGTCAVLQPEPPSARPMPWQMGAPRVSPTPEEFIFQPAVPPAEKNTPEPGSLQVLGEGVMIAAMAAIMLLLSVAALGFISRGLAIKLGLALALVLILGAILAIG